jgi:hypothetical protein
MEYEHGGRPESFRTTVSKKILDAYRKDRSLMDGFDWGGYLKLHKGKAPLVDGEPMLDSHAHHGSAPQKGRPQEVEIVQKCQDLLWEEGIDPLFGLEQLGWASKSAIGQHTMAEWEVNLGKLQDLQRFKSDYNDFAAKTQEFSDIAKARKLDPATAQQFRQKRAEQAAKQTEKTAKKSPSSESASSDSVAPKASPLKPSKKSRK